ncbi:MAG: hypothetical protein M0Q26_09855 [Chitinophagaceae bacterium]|nr:hypothetical protein [Chitinophagaceae bacterium]
MYRYLKYKLSLAAFFLVMITWAQTAINSSHFQVMGARALGPSTMSGRITSIEGITVAGQVNLYVGTAGGGIWKSQNGGQSFNPVFDKYCQSIGALAVEPGNAKVVYAGTGESNTRNSVSIGDGLYKTTDGGNNWQKMGLDSTERISKILIDPSDKKNIYVAAPGPLWKSSSHRGLYKSTDGGKTWNKLLYVNEETGCADIALHPQKSNIILASFWQFRRKPYAFNSGGPGSGLFKSTDGGKTWHKLTRGLPEGDLGRMVITINPSQPSEVLAIVEAKIPGLYLSLDEGETWKKLAATENITARPFYFSTLVYDPGDPKRVYRPAFDFAYSIDGGYSWSNTTIGGVQPHADHHALWVNPNNTEMMFLGTDGGVYQSLNKGSSWQFLNNLPVGQFYHVSVDNQLPYKIYGGLQDNYSWIAPNTAPGGVSSADWRIIGGGDGFWVQPSPVNPKIVFSESQGGEITRADLATGLSFGIKPKKLPGDDEHRFNWNTPIVTGSSVKKGVNGKPLYNLYIASQYLFKSTDDGRNWERISPDLTTNNKAKQQQSESSGGITGDNTSAENHCTIFTVVQHPKNEHIIWVGTDDGNLQYTGDAGKTWQNKASGIWQTGVPENSWISSIEISSLNPKRMYVTLDNHMYGDNNTYLVVSYDAGNTWKRLVSTEFTGFAHIVREDIVNDKLLFLGTEMGLFISLDGGNQWMRSKYQNMPWYNLVRDIKIQPQTNDLVIASHGRGIYVIDNLQPLRDLVKSDVNKEAILYPIQSFTYDFAAQLPIAPPNLAGWVGENKVVSPVIYYYLKQRSNDAVKIEIYDADNKKIKDFNGSGLKGLNKVYWGLNTNPPKVALGGFTTGSSVQYASFISPKVPVGKYKVVIKADGKLYEEFIHIKANTEKGFTAQSIGLLYKQGMRLHGLQEKLAVLVDTLDKTIALLNKIEKKEEPNKTKLEKLTELRKEIIEMNRTSIFFDEFKFRRRVSDLYVSVATAIEPLSARQEKSIRVLENEFELFKEKAGALLK